MNEFKCKSTIVFRIITNKSRGSVIETMLMTMTMEINMEAFNILVPSPLVWWCWWRPSRQGFAVVAMEWARFFLGSPPLYIGSRRAPNDPLVIPYVLGEVWE
jgi:hypothetical protein